MKNKLESILGYAPGRELKKMILTGAKNEGLPVEEVAARYQLPEIAILDLNGTFEVDGQRMTPAEFEKKNPYRKLVTIGTKKE